MIPIPRAPGVFGLAPGPPSCFAWATKESSVSEPCVFIGLGRAWRNRGLSHSHRQTWNAWPPLSMPTSRRHPAGPGKPNEGFRWSASTTAANLGPSISTCSEEVFPFRHFRIPRETVWLPTTTVCGNSKWTVRANWTRMRLMPSPPLALGRNGQPHTSPSQQANKKSSMAPRSWPRQRGTANHHCWTSKGRDPSRLSWTGPQRCLFRLSLQGRAGDKWLGRSNLGL